MIVESRRNALSAVNRELVCLYWQIGRIIVQQQESARWGDAVVEQLSADLRAAYPDFRGVSLPNLWRMRQLFLAYRRIDGWLVSEKLSTPSRETGATDIQPEILSTLSREFSSPELPGLILGLSWSHHTLICSESDRTDQQYFYLRMAIRERWSFRELERQLDSDLFTRYVSVKRDPEKCLPADCFSAPPVWKSPTLGLFNGLPISASVLRKSEPNAPTPLPPELVLRLTWTHLAEVVRIEAPWKCAFYETECLKSNWSERKLQRQIGSLLYERTGLSTDKLHDPCIREFVGLNEQPQYSETERDTGSRNAVRIGTTCCVELLCRRAVEH